MNPSNHATINRPSLLTCPSWRREGLDLAVRTMKPKERAVFEAEQNMEALLLCFFVLCMLMMVSDGHVWGI